MIRALGAAALYLGLSLPLVAAPAETPSAPPTPEQLAARERIRPKVEALWRDARTPDLDEDAHPHYFSEVTDALIALGPDVVPFLTAEIDLMDPATFHFCAYALGRLGGPDAEAALRKAVRVADARGGRFGQACKRYAVYGLALLGSADALDLVQDGEEIQNVEMTPDLPLIVHLATMLGREAAPVLLKQFETYAADPDATGKLQFTLMGLGRSGDASLVPKLLPLLRSTSTGVRAQAADAIARLGDPGTCLQLMPLLADAKQRENYVVAEALERVKPEPCYKPMLARLEVEDNIEVRAHLYAAVAALGGEGALDAFRLYIGSRDPIGRTLVAEMLGRIGSKKGLNMVRALLADPSPNVAQRAVMSLAEIGGEGATDSLLAMTADPRRPVAATAARELIELGVQRAGPRLAANLLAMVREPVGVLETRAPIAMLCDGLVALRYAEAIDDLRKAIDVQSDPEIRESLTSCVRRLELLVKNGDDPGPWIEALNAPFADVRTLAATRLTELPAPAGIQALEARLARTDLARDERVDILEAIGRARTAAAAAAVERHLSDPAFDDPDEFEVRAEAAWAARRIGGDRMARALRSAAVRRDGRDWATLVYLAVLEKGAAADTLKTLKALRLRYPSGRGGHEDKQLDDILADLAGGRAPSLYDVPPERLFAM